MSVVPIFHSVPAKHGAYRKRKELRKKVKDEVEHLGTITVHVHTGGPIKSQEDVLREIENRSKL